MDIFRGVIISSMKNQKWIMIVYNRMNLGGIQVKLIDILDELVSQHIRVMLVLRIAEGEFIKEIPREVHVVNLRLGKNFIDAFLMMRNLVFLIAKFHPASILTFADHVSSLVVLAKTLLMKWNTPIFIAEGIHLSTYLKFQPLGKIRSVMVKLLYPLATKVIVLTEAQREDLINYFRIPSRKIIINPNWVSRRFTRHLRGAEPTKTIDILFVGRLEPQKNLLAFLEIVKKLTLSGLRLSVVIVGDGSQREALERWSKQHHIGSAVSFIGFSVNTAKYFRRAKIFLLTSLYEGQPHSVIEAMRAGIPVVALKSLGIDELIIHGRTGYIALDIQQATEYLISLLSNSSLRQELGYQGKIAAIDKYNKKNLKKIISYLV